MRKLEGRWRVYEEGEWALHDVDGDTHLIWAFDPSEKTVTKYVTEAEDEREAWREFEDEAGLVDGKFTFRHDAVDLETISE